MQASKRPTMRPNNVVTGHGEHSAKRQVIISCILSSHFTQTAPQYTMRTQIDTYNVFIYYKAYIVICVHSMHSSLSDSVFMRPVLEYCSPVWSPCTVTAINKLESVHARMFTKRLPGMLSLSYDATAAVGSQARIAAYSL